MIIKYIFWLTKRYYGQVKEKLCAALKTVCLPNLRNKAMRIRTESIFIQVRNSTIPLSYKYLLFEQMCFSEKKMYLSRYLRA